MITDWELQPGDRVRFDGKATSWLVRATTKSGRYVLATASYFGHVAYTIIDRQNGIRGPLNIVGQGMGIFTTIGPDDAIAESVTMLEEGEADEADAASRGASCTGQWEVSHRNRVPVRITRIDTTGQNGVANARAVLEGGGAA